MLTEKQLDARIEAFVECIGHLDCCWTDDELERQQGVCVQGFLQTQVDNLVDRKIRLQQRETLAKSISENILKKTRT